MELEGTGVRATVLRPGPTLTGMGMDWDPEAPPQRSSRSGPSGASPATRASCGPKAWRRRCSPWSDMPRGVYVTTIELQPEAPIEEDRP